MALDLHVPTAVLRATRSEALESKRSGSTNWHADTVRLSPSDLTDEVLDELQSTAISLGDYENEKFARAVKGIADARRGVIKTIPSLAAAPEIMTKYLQNPDAFIDGWLYTQGSDGHMHPWLVTGIRIEPGRGPGEESYLQIHTTADFPFKQNERAGRSVDSSNTIMFGKGDVSRKRPDAILLSKGWVRETPELKAAYLERIERFQQVMNGGFAKQFRYTGQPSLTDYWKTPNEVKNRKVVMDVKPSELSPLREKAESELSTTMLSVPTITTTRVFDLSGHEFWNVNVNDLTDYIYDDTLKDKLILPQDQRDLLDVLTTDLEAFAADIIEGKSAGNVVLAKGVPGVGKTLTAEVYAEIVKRPLYSIHSGVLGVTAPDVRKNLEEAFSRAQRWNAVLLLDEADVFVLARKDNIVQNAITAEFLRTLEYFDGLLFMTTNRLDDIDDAIISRCAALIDYQLPSASDAAKIWRVMANNMGVTALSDELIAELVDGLEASPRDIKMLLRLTLRMAASKQEPLSLQLFAKCAMFRGLHLNTKEA